MYLSYVKSWLQSTIPFVLGMDTLERNYVQIHPNEADWILQKAMRKAYYLDISSFHELIHDSIASTFVPDYFLS